MGIAHILYIPFAIVLGVAVGFVLGARATQDAYRRERERQAKQAKAQGRSVEDEAHR